MDHDQRFKELIRLFFADFLRLFFADWAARFDLSSVEWLDKELLPDPPEGDRHLLDLVARVRSLQPLDGTDNWLALVHMEIESPDRTALLKPRLPRYYIHLRDRYGLRVLPIVLYLKVGLEGLGVDIYEETFWELQTLRFQYLYVGLPGLDALEYVRGDNWLGVALSALMRIPREEMARLGAEALLRIAEAPLSGQQRYLLADCVQAYLPLDGEQQQRFEQILLGEPHAKVQAMNKTVYDQGLEKGLKQGRQEGRQEGRVLGLRRAVSRLLEVCLNVPVERVEGRLEGLTAEQLDDLLPRIPRATSLKDLGLED